MIYEYSPNDDGGTYKIINLKTDEYYLCSTSNYKLRWNADRKLLEDNCFPNEMLQKDFNDLGHKSFKFKAVLSDSIDMKNQYYVPTIKLPEDFPVPITVKKSEKRIWKIGKEPKSTRSEELKEAIRLKKFLDEKHERLYKEDTQYKETFDKKQLKLKQYPEDGKVVKTSIPRKCRVINLRVYTFINPEGKHISINNIANWTKIMGYDANGFYRLSKGVHKSYVGYTFHSLTIENNPYCYWFFSEEHGHFSCINIHDFCRKYNLDVQQMISVGLGKQKSYNGWISKKTAERS